MINTFGGYIFKYNKCECTMIIQAQCMQTSGALMVLQLSPSPISNVAPFQRDSQPLMISKSARVWRFNLYPPLLAFKRTHSLHWPPVTGLQENTQPTGSAEHHTVIQLNIMIQYCDSIKNTICTEPKFRQLCHHLSTYGTDHIKCSTCGQKILFFVKTNKLTNNKKDIKYLVIGLMGLYL